MSCNYHDKTKENNETFNLSKEEMFNCFGSQLYSQSSNSNNDYQIENVVNFQKVYNVQSQAQTQPENKQNSNSSMINGNDSKIDLIINLILSLKNDNKELKDEIRALKEKIQKLENLENLVNILINMVMNNNGNNNKKSLSQENKKIDYNSLLFNLNNNIKLNKNENNNNNLNNSKQNIFANNDNNSIFEEKNNQLSPKKKEIKKEQKKSDFHIKETAKIVRGKSSIIHINPKSSMPETVLEVEEEYENTAKDIRKREKQNPIKQFSDPLMDENEEENISFKFEDIKDDEFDAVLKNKNGIKNKALLQNDLFKKSSELKSRPDKSSINEDLKNGISDDNNIPKNINYDNINNNDFGNFNFDQDEIVSDFMAGGKKVNIKLNDNIRKKINSLNEPLDELDNNDSNDSDEIVSDFMVGGKKINIKLNDDLRKKEPKLNEPKNELAKLDFNKDEIVSDFMAGNKKINIKLNDDIRKEISNLNEPLENLEELDNFKKDEIVSDFMVGGKKINIKLNDDIRKKINSLNEPLDNLEELDKGKESSKINYNISKLSCTSLISKDNNMSINNVKEKKVKSKMKEISLKIKPGKRNYNAMIEGSKKIEEKEKDNSKNEEKKEKKKEGKEGKEESKNGSSVKERGHFIKKIKKFRHSNDIIISNEINNIKNNSNPNSIYNPQSRLSSMKKMSKINNKKYMYSTISSYQFYCICKKSNSKDSLKCQICQDSFIININNFMRGFYYYILFLDNKPNNNIGIDISDSTFKLLEKNNIIEKDPNFNQYKELEQFFNYQFILITYDKYYKFAQKNNNNELVENSIEEIYDKIIPKYIQIFIKGNRSFLTEVSEGDSALGYMNILLFLMNINNNDNSLNGETTLEFSDGYKSCYAIINNNDPINILLDQTTLHNWMNVEIGMSKVLKVSEDFKLYIKIYYNSISASDNSDNNKENIIYGPLLEKKLLLKNITELNNDGGEISLIKVIIIKKYDYYVKNITKKISYSRRKYENEMMKIPDSDKKNYDDDDSEGKIENQNEIKEPDKLSFLFKAIAMDYEIYNILKKNSNNKNMLEHLLKKKYIITFKFKTPYVYENIFEGKMYQLMYLNLEANNNYSNQNKIYNKNRFYNKENDIQITFSDKSYFDEVTLNSNYKSEKEYIDTFDIINKNLNLTNNIDIGKLFVESIDNNKQINNDDYFNKEFFISGIYSGYLDKIKYNVSSELENNEKSGSKGNNEEYIERYIFISLGMKKVAILKLHREDFFYIDVKSNFLKDKLINIYDVLFKEILNFDNDNNQPKITGRKKFENSIPILNIMTNCYTSIQFGNNTKNKEQIDQFYQYQKSNKNFIDLLKEAIGCN